LRQAARETAPPVLFFSYSNEVRMSDNPQNANTPPDRNREAQRRKANEFFREKETRKAMLYQAMETERTVSDEKTAKLRALRLARDAAKD
jgi:hypothetical protein